MTHSKDDHRSPCNVCGKIGHKAEVCWFRPGVNRSSSSGSSSSARTVTCFTCKKERHKSIDCPEKGKTNTSSHSGRKVKKEGGSASVERINLVIPKPTKDNAVQAKVNGKDTDILLDSGADLEVVPSLVTENACTGEVVKGTGALEEQHKVARVTFRFGSKKMERLVIVDEEENYPFVCLFAFKVRDKEEWEFFGKLFHGTKALREANP